MPYCLLEIYICNRNKKQEYVFIALFKLVTKMQVFTFRWIVLATMVEKGTNTQKRSILCYARTVPLALCSTNTQTIVE